MITYSTNWMGPIANSWYRDRGLTRKVEYTYKYGPKKGVTELVDEITEHYCCGRIDIRDDSKEGYEGWHEYSIAPMHREDWARFSNWLDHHVTQELWTFEELIETYERNNPKIRWLK